MMHGDALPSAWRAGPKMPTRRLEPGVTALATQLVVLGGFDTGVSEGLHITDVVDVFDTETQTWLAPLPPAPVQWSHIDLATNGSTLFLLGGLEGEQFIARGDAWALDAGASAWRPLAPLPTGLERGAAGVVAAPGHIYLLGGASTTDALATCLDYDIANDSWSPLPALPAPRSHPAAMRMADGTLIVAAGLRTIDSTKPLSDVLALPPGATAWETRTATLSVPRGGCAYGTLGDQLICVGGESGQSALNAVALYAPCSIAGPTSRCSPSTAPARRAPRSAIASMCPAARPHSRICRRTRSTSTRRRSDGECRESVREQTGARYARACVCSTRTRRAT